MFLGKCFRDERSGLLSLGRNAIACILVCGFCALTSPALAKADDGGMSSTPASQQLHFGTQLTLGSMAERATTTPRWTLQPEPSWLAAPATLEFPAPGMIGQPTHFTRHSFAAFALPGAASPPSSSGSGHGHWLALGVAGIVVAAVGAVAYAGEQGSICGGSPNPGKGCSEVKTAGLVLMPVGGVMAVVGFVMNSRH